MKAEIKGKKLLIELDIKESESKSGKSTVVATTGGNILTDVDYNGKKLTIGVNAYVKKD